MDSEKRKEKLLHQMLLLTSVGSAICILEIDELIAYHEEELRTLSPSLLPDFKPMLEFLRALKSVMPAIEAMVARGKFHHERMKKAEQN